MQIYVVFVRDIAREFDKQDTYHLNMAHSANPFTELGLHMEMDTEHIFV